jgi:hypothetical protein
MGLLANNQVLAVGGEVNLPDDGIQQRPTPSQKEIVDPTSRIYGGNNPWTKGPAYSYYFLNLPGIYSIWPEVAADYNELIKPGASALKFSPYQGAEKLVVTCSIPPSMRTPIQPPKLPFQPLPPVIPAPPQDLQLCIALDGLGVTIPEAAAQIVAASFTTGFVGRLVLNEFMKAGGKDSSKLDQWGFKRDIPNPTSFLQGYGGTRESFQARLDKLSSLNVLQGTGIFLGWRAGGELGTEKDDYLAAAWTLVKLRFSPSQLGEITSYCLGFILAFIRIQVARQKAQPQQKAPNPNARMDEILAKMRDDPGINKFQMQISEFFDGVVTAVQNAPNASANGNIQFGYDFLRGYNHGCLRSSTDVFGWTLRVGYGIGYADGYAIGYQAGYAAGYRDGLNAAADNWAKAIDDFVKLADDIVTTTGKIAGVAATIIAFA